MKILKNRHAREYEREKMERLEQAERDLLALQRRAAKARRTLRERNQRNHWRDSIEQMIQQGAT